VKRIIILTAALLAIFTGAAFAAESNPTSENSIVTTTIPVVFELSIRDGSGNPYSDLDAAVTPTEAQILAGDATIYTLTSAGHLGIVSNYNSTTLTAQTTGFGANNQLIVTLKARKYTVSGGQNGFATILNNGTPTAPQTMATWAGSGVNLVPVGAPVAYELSDVSVADDQGTYSATVVYTLSGSNP